MARLIRFIPIFLISLLLMSWIAGASERFPPPEFEGGRELPNIQTPAPRADYMGYVDVGVLLFGLIFASWLVLKKRSKRWITGLGIFSLAYFGFFRQGCVCAIGSIGNVTQAIFDPTYSASLVILAFFFLPLAFTVFFGRSFCASVCPHGAIQDLILIKPIEIPLWLEKSLRIFAYGYLGLSVLYAAASPMYLICRYDPFIPIFRMTGSWGGFLLGFGFLGVGMFIGRPYCRFMCPYGVLLGWLGAVAKKNVEITPDACIDCRLCEHSCPYNAIIPSALDAEKTNPAVEKKRLTWAIAMVPILVAIFAWAGGQIGGALSRAHYNVTVAEDVYLRDAGLTDPVPDDNVQAFKGTGKKTEVLYAEAVAIAGRFTFGSYFFGGFMGLVIGLKLAGAAVRSKRKDYHIDAENCIACGRCYDSCSVEQLRVGSPEGDPDMKEALAAQYQKEAANS